jgi:peroxiredoxin
LAFLLILVYDGGLTLWIHRTYLEKPDMREARNLVIGVLGGFLIGIVVIYFIARLRSPQKISDLIGEEGASIKVQVDAIAPDFELESLSGEWIRLSELNGKVVLINFWATWCGPCRVEMPAFQSRYEHFSEDLVILAINEHDTPDEMQTFIDESGFTFNVLYDVDGTVHREYLVRGFPTSFLVDADGKLRIQHIGMMTETQLDDYLAEVGL